MRLLKGFVALLIIASGVLILMLNFGGERTLGRAERIGRMAWHQVFYRWKKPIPTTPKLKKLRARLDKKGLKLGAPIFMRIFKKEAKLEIWMKKGAHFTHFATYPICFFSGRLGPKRKQGDRQAPEGFYTVDKRQLNPNSRHHRSFNLGYPNLFDRAHRRTGDYLMVHGGCTSIGCYAMTDKVIDEIWLIVTNALNNGQQRFHVQALPFRMTRRNMRRYRKRKWASFWRDLKKGYDLFEETKIPPRVSVCKKRYQVRIGDKGTSGSSPLTKNCLQEARNQRLSPRFGRN